MKNILITHYKENLTSFVILGSFLVFIGFLDVLVNTFLNLNFTGFLPSKLSFFTPLIIGTIGLSGIVAKFRSPSNFWTSCNIFNERLIEDCLYSILNPNLLLYTDIILKLFNIGVAINS